MAHHHCCDTYRIFHHWKKKPDGFFGGEEKKQVVVEKVEVRDITEIVSASGKIQPEVEVKISPDVSGEIVELNVKEGDRVHKGQLLVRILPDIYQSRWSFSGESQCFKSQFRQCEITLVTGSIAVWEKLNWRMIATKIVRRKLISPSDWEACKNPNSMLGRGCGLRAKFIRRWLQCAQRGKRQWKLRITCAKLPSLLRWMERFPN